MMENLWRFLKHHFYIILILTLPKRIIFMIYNLDVLDKIDEIIKKHKNDLIIAKDLLIDLK